MMTTHNVGLVTEAQDTCTQVHTYSGWCLELFRWPCHSDTWGVTADMPAGPAYGERAAPGHLPQW